MTKSWNTEHLHNCALKGTIDHVREAKTADQSYGNFSLTLYNVIMAYEVFSTGDKIYKYVHLGS